MAQSMEQPIYGKLESSHRNDPALMAITHMADDMRVLDAA